jgi:ribonucleoside-diphosphate reductase alpha chain
LVDQGHEGGRRAGTLRPSQIHLLAWKRGLKSLYDCRSLSIQRADTVSEKAVQPGEILLPAANDHAELPPVAAAARAVDYEEYLACH